MDLLSRQNPWRVMLAVNVAVMSGVLIHKITLPPYVPYIHLLVDYHFGFVKRALIGAVVSLFTEKVPVWLVFALGGAIWVLTAFLFVKLFRRTFGFDDAHMPLFVFTAGSPFFLKNFMHTLGHFDIYGCLFAIVLLLIPAQSIGFVLLATFFSVVLILIHHIHFLMYVPTIAAIVLLRHYLTTGIDRPNLAAGAISLLALGALFVALQFWGTMPIPEAEFVAYLKTRMADPARTDLLNFSYIWYQPLAKEISDTWARMPSNILGVPVFALLIWLHSPLWRYLSDLIRSLDRDFHRRIVVASIVAVSVAYLIMFAIVFDYSRWISNWAVCMFLILIHHIHLLMYVPTIAVIVILRHYLSAGIDRTNLAAGAISLLVLGALFVALQFWGTMPIPEAEFIAYLKTRMADPARTDLLGFSFIWYQTLPKEISDTWARLPSNILGVPVFALLIWLHSPLWRYFADLIRSLDRDFHRRIVVASIIAVSAAYLIMFAIVFDYSRWISNWAVCLFLILHAVKTLPSSRAVPPIAGDDKKTGILGWVVTLVPRVGVIRPF